MGWTWAPSPVIGRTEGREPLCRVHQTPLQLDLEYHRHGTPMSLYGQEDPVESKEMGCGFSRGF